MKHVAPSCPLCSRQGRFVLQQRDVHLGIHPELTHSLYRCEPCDFFFLSSIPDDLLRDYYPTAYYGDENVGLFRSALRQYRVARRARSVEWRVQRGKALDVGCGRGSLLQELARRGWEVAGTDWNANNACAVVERLGIHVEGGDNALAAFADSSFDVVSLLHVLEHDGGPVDLLKEVRRVLKPGGRLLVAVPNARSAARGIFRRYWFGYDVPRHRCIFTPRSLRLALDGSGFRLERLTGRISDEALDVHGSVGLFLGTRRVRRPILQLSIALLAFTLLYPARLLGFYSIMYGYARKL